MMQLDFFHMLVPGYAEYSIVSTTSTKLKSYYESAMCNLFSLAPYLAKFTMVVNSKQHPVFG